MSDLTAIYFSRMLRLVEEFVPALFRPPAENRTHAAHWVRLMEHRGGLLAGIPLTKDHPEFTEMAPAELAAKLTQETAAIAGAPRMLASMDEHLESMKRAAFIMAGVVRAGHRLVGREVWLDGIASTALRTFIKVNCATAVPVLTARAMVTAIQCAVDAHMPGWTVPMAVTMMRAIPGGAESVFAAASGWATGAGEDRAEARDVTVDWALRVLEAVAWGSRPEDGDPLMVWRNRVLNLASSLEDAANQQPEEEGRAPG